MAGLAVHLLGPFDATVDGRVPVAFQLDRMRALLAYLAVESDRPHLREALACLFWPDASSDSAHTNLRQAIYKLRLALGEQRQPRFLRVSPSFIQLPASEETWVDARVFSTLIQSVQKHQHPQFTQCPECLATLRQATELYQGDFLSDLALPDSLPYQEWVAVKQAELRDHMLNALSLLSEAAWERADYVEADAFARQHLVLEPWSEEAHRLKMRVAAVTGRRSAALHQYDVCRRILRDELGVEPDPATEALCLQIKAGVYGDDLPLRHPLLGSNLSERDTVQSVAGEPELRSPDVELDQELRRESRSRFVARERECAWLDHRLSRMLEREGQVALVTGSPGSGKSALLEHFASRALHADPSLVVVGAPFNLLEDGGGLSVFVEILRLLAGDRMAYRATGVATPEQMARARVAFPAFLAALAAEGPDLAGLIAGCGSWDIGNSEGTAKLSPEQRQVQATLVGARQPANRPSSAVLFEQFVRTLHVLARTHPLVILLGDLQWMGADAAALLFYFTSRLARSRIFLLGEYRSGAWTGDGAARQPFSQVIDELRARFGDIEIDLDRADGRSFVDAYLETVAASSSSDPIAGDWIANDLKEAIFTRTQGHPLFTIELVRMLKEHADAPGHEMAPRLTGEQARQLSWEGLPARLDAILAERLSGLPLDWQRTLEIASVQGSVFAAEVVALVQGMSNDEIVARLSGPLFSPCRLVQADQVQRGKGWRLSLYRFQNAFVRDLLYGRVDPVRRVRWHEATAEALEKLLPDDRGHISQHLAWHFQLAGNAEKAAAYREQAEVTGSGRTPAP